MVKGTWQEQTMFNPHKEPLGVKTPEEDHLEEDHLGEHLGETYQEEAH